MARPHKPTPLAHDATSSGIDVLDRAAAILFAFQLDERPLTLTELAERAGLYKSTALRLASALCHHRLLMRLDDGRFLLGSATLKLAASYQSSLNLGEVLLPLMRRLNEATGEAVSFHVREGNQRVCLYRINSRHSIRAEVQQGDVQPLERGAGGRILLAFSAQPGEPYETIRSTFFYASVGERDPETSGISCPVFGVQQSLVGALGLVGPSSRLSLEAMQRHRAALLATAAEATHLFGGDAAALRAAARDGAA